MNIEALHYFSARCEFDLNRRVAVTSVYHDYLAWRHHNELPYGDAMSRNQFSKAFRGVIEGRAERKNATFDGQAALAYVGVGLKPLYAGPRRPQSVSETNESLFLKERTEATPGAKCTASQLYAAYKRYCKAKGLPVLLKRPFLRAVKSHCSGATSYGVVRVGNETSKGFTGLELLGEQPEIARCPTCNQTLR